MCNWISSLFISALLWGFQDSVCDIIIGNKPEKNKICLEDGNKKEKVKDELDTSLNANQTIFLCMIAAFIMVNQNSYILFHFLLYFFKVYFYSLWIIFSYDNYMLFMEHSSLLFQKTYVNYSIFY